MVLHHPLLTKILVNLVLGCVMTYIVYRDAKKYDVPHKEIWIVGTFLIPFIAVVYFLYTRALKTGMVLSKRQAILAARRKKQKARQNELREEKQKLAGLQRQLTPEERAQEEADKAKKLQELEEQRKYKHDLLAKKIKFKK